MRNLLICAAFTVLCSPPVCGQNAAWVNPDGGFYESSSNWVPSGVPGPANDVLFNVGGSYSVGIQGDRTANSLLVPLNVDLTFASGGPGDLAFTYSLDADAVIDRGELTLGDESQGRLLNLEVGGKLAMRGGRLNLLNGVQLTSQTSLTNSNSIEGAGGVDSVIIVQGTDAAGQPSRWQSIGGTDVGDSGGAASLSIHDGGQVSSAGTVAIGGNVMADGSSLQVHGTTAAGAPSSLTSNAFRVGFVGSSGGLSRATVQVSAGGYLSTGAAEVRNDSLVLIDGEDANLNASQWQAESVSVLGGFVDVVDGGYLSSDFVNLNRLAIARVNGVGASGRPSQWDINGNLRLGASNGFGSLLIDSGHVTSGTAEIGAGTGLSLLSVEGQFDAPGVWENTGDVYVGGSANGSEAEGLLRLFDDDARVTVGGTLTVWNSGTISMHSGVLLADTIDHTHGGAFDFNSGTLSVNTFDGDLLSAGGVFAPNLDDAGATTVFGNYTQQASSTLALGIGGTGPGSTHDLVNITGAAQIDGLLELALMDGYQPDPDDELTLLAANSLFGFFDNVNTGQRLDTADGRGSFVVNYGIGSAFDEDRIVLSDFQAADLLPGDYDGDENVGGNDFLAWQRSDGTPSGLSAWQSNYGRQAPTLAAATSVPEATSIALSLFVAFTLAATRFGHV